MGISPRYGPRRLLGAFKAVRPPWWALELGRRPRRRRGYPWERPRPHDKQDLARRGGTERGADLVAVQDKCPSKWPAEMSLGQVAMVSDGDVAGAARSCRVGGPSASR